MNGCDWINRKRDWENLPAALHKMKRDLSYIYLEGIGSVATVFPSVIPERPDEPHVEFTIRVPAHGGGLHRAIS